MEVNKLQGFVLLIILVGMILGAGVLVLDKFGVTVKTATTVTNETVTISSGTATLTYDDVTALTTFLNVSETFISGNESDDDRVNYTAAGVITTALADGSYNASYTYDADSVTTTNVFASRDEVSNISTNWLGLIVTIAILAIIITLIIRSFGANKR